MNCRAAYPSAAVLTVGALALGLPALAGQGRQPVTGEGTLFPIRWGDVSSATLSWPDRLPDVIETGRAQPLGRFHDRLLTLPLARPIAGLPAGARFEAPAGSSRMGLVRIPGDTGGIATLW